MPNISETIKIIENTPVEQAILLEGIHGIGKSETISEHFKSQGYKTIVLFLGQLADAGDVLGLPDRVDSNGIKKTEFCPPGWWPTGPEMEQSKILLFLDEINRAKPELQQVIMDLVLNRKLHGRSLPAKTKIVAAQNPMEGGEYQVEELDPALLDRFNKYEFKPDVEEWVNWAAKNKVHKIVIDFIFKNKIYLDPPAAKELKSGHVYPSRRSWKRVSDIFNANPKLVDDQVLRDNLLFGIIGIGAAAAFSKFIREQGNGISASKILVNWDKSVQEAVKKLDVQDHVSINRNLVVWFQENESNLKASDNMAAKWAYNLQQYLESISAEAMADFVNHMTSGHNDKRKWPSAIMKLNSKIAKRFIEILHGKDPEEEEEKKKWS